MQHTGDIRRAHGKFEFECHVDTHFVTLSRFIVLFIFFPVDVLPHSVPVNDCFVDVAELHLSWNRRRHGDDPPNQSASL